LSIDVHFDLEPHRGALTGYCYRMLGSSFEAEDAVQETMLRAWRAADGFDGRAAVRSWLYRIATNVCLDALRAGQRRARPMDLGPARAADGPLGAVRPEVSWLEPIPDARVLAGSDPAEVAVARESVRLAFVAALQELAPQQRAVLILREVLRWPATEVAELLDTTVAAVNSALQRARATIAARNITPSTSVDELDDADRDLLERYVDAFQRYDMDALQALLHEDATQSMPPFELWLSGRDQIFTFWLGHGAGCRGSQLVPVESANGSPAFGQYKPSGPNGEFEPWALQVIEIVDGRIAELTFFLDTQTVFPQFGLSLTRPARTDGVSGR